MTTHFWSTIKDMTNSYNKTPPRYIDYDNRPVTLLRKIDDIANRHYIDKIDKIRQNFKKHRLTHIDLLKMIVLRPKTTFSILYITLDQTIKLTSDDRCLTRRILYSLFNQGLELWLRE